MSQPAGATRSKFAPHEWEDSMKEKMVFQPSAMRCPVCSQTWLVAGARRGEAYLCKRCGSPLLAEAPEPLPNERPRAKPRGEVRGGV